MYTCQICGNEYNEKGMGSHIVRKHHITVKDYYDTYMKKDNEGYCDTCGIELKFYRLGAAYSKYCSHCSKLIGLQAARDKYNGAPASDPEVMHKMQQTCLERYGATNVFASDYGKQKIKETCLEKYNVEYTGQIQSKKDNMNYHDAGLKAKEHILSDINKYCLNNDLTLLSNLLDKYNQGWFKYFNPDIVFYKGYRLVSSSYEEKAKQYYEYKLTNKSRSYCEQEIIDYIKTIYDGTILTNNRTAIKPYELDIYLPDIKIAIEENDSFWHSQDNPFSRIEDYDEYHNKKRELCQLNEIKLLVIEREQWLNNNIECKHLIEKYIF